MKRLTSREKWEDKWFRKLPLRLKCLWDWLYTHCDGAGVIDPDLELASFEIGEDVTADDLEKEFGEERIRKMDGTKIHLVKFIEFQYGALSPDSPPHQHVIDLCKKYGIVPPLKTKKTHTKTAPEVSAEPPAPAAPAIPSKPPAPDKYDAAIEEIITYFNTQAGTSYRSDGKAMRSNVTARLDAGFTIDDFKKVIDKKCKSWKNDEKMVKFLRPITLFSVTHFENYLNEKEVKAGGAAQQTMDDLYGKDQI